MVIRLGRGADLQMVQLMPLPLTISCSNKSRLVLPSYFTLLVSAHPGSPEYSPGGCETIVVAVVAAVVDADFHSM